MTPLGVLVLSTTGMLLAGGLVVTGWSTRPSLARSIRHLRRAEPSPSMPADLATTIGRTGWMATWRDRADRCRRPLRLIGRTPERHVGLLVLAAAAGFLAPITLLGALQLVGLVSTSWYVPLVVATSTGAGAMIVTHSDAMSRSAEVRRDLRHQLSAYLDVVSMLLAGNSGYEGALGYAARSGDGLLFSELRRRMREADTSGRSHISALAIVADDYGIDELQQVAATASLSAAEGAPVARTLAAKCATLRSTMAADLEASARIRSDKVTPPLVGMALLFMALIIYPALDLT